MEDNIPTGKTMSDGMPTVEPQMTPGEQCVPLAILAQPDESETLQSPVEGDTVSGNFDAVINRIEGDNAYITISAVNGKPLEDESSESTPDSENPSVDEIEKQYAAAPDEPIE